MKKIHLAARTFQGKYGYLQGDIKDPDASNFGVAARGAYQSKGDGNGILEGTSAPGGTTAGTCPGSTDGVNYFGLAKVNALVNVPIMAS